MSFSNKKPRIVVIGAGISGLALGWFLRQRQGSNIDLRIIEASDRVGGWIRTNKCGNFLFEAGPRSCRARGNATETLELIEALGITDQVIFAAPGAKTRYLCVNGSLQRLPQGFLSLMTSPLTRGVVSSLWKERCIPASHRRDESIAEFVGRRFGQDIAERFFDPLVSGIYAGDIRRLSIRSCFPDLHRMEQESGSIVRGVLKSLFKKRIKPSLQSEFVRMAMKSSIFSFRNGMETLTDRLGLALKDELTTRCRVLDVKICANEIEIATETQGRIWADHVYIATPAHVAASIVKNVSSELVDQMTAIPSATVAVVNLGWNQKLLHHEGFGYLVPTREQEEILGVVWDSSVFPQQNHTSSQTRLTVMMGGAHHPVVEKLSPDEILRRALTAVSKHMGIHQEPDAKLVIMAREAIPQYPVDFHVTVNAIQDNLSALSASRIHLLGSSWRGVSIHDCISNARQISCMLPRPIHCCSGL